MAKRTTLYSPDGRKYETGDPAEITRLKAQGYTDKQQASNQPASKSASSKDSS